MSYPSYPRARAELDTDEGLRKAKRIKLQVAGLETEDSWPPSGEDLPVIPDGVWVSGFARLTLDKAIRLRDDLDDAIRQLQLLQRHGLGGQEERADDGDEQPEH